MFCLISQFLCCVFITFASSGFGCFFFVCLLLVVNERPLHILFDSATTIRIIRVSNVISVNLNGKLFIFHP